MKIFGLETTGSFTGNISGSVTSTGSFGRFRVADKVRISNTTDAPMAKLVVGATAPNVGSSVVAQFDGSIRLENYVIMHDSSNNSNAVGWFHNSNNIMELMSEGSGTTNLYIPGNVSGSITSTGSFGSVQTDGNVGVNTLGSNAVRATLHVADDNSFSGADGQIVFALTPSVSNNESAGMVFGTYNDDEYWKQGIFWKRNASYGRGELHFAVRAATDTTTVSISDSKMMIDNSGNVGIGTTSPGFKLHVSASSDNLHLESGGTGGPSFRMTDNSASSDGDMFGFIDFSANHHAGSTIVFNRISNVMVDNTQGTTDSRLTIHNHVAGTLTEVLSVASGKVGIGTTNPQEMLDVSGSEPSIRIGDSAANKHFNIKVATGGGVSKFRVNSETHSNTLVVTNNKKVGINQGAPSVALDVVGDTKITGNAEITGSLIVQGDVTAKTLIISSSVTNLTTQFASGSTRFGDTQDDLHEFTGSLRISGSSIHLNDAKNNVILGPTSSPPGDGITTGTFNVLLGGNNAGGAINTGAQNIGIGGSALEQLQTGDNCVAIGYNTGQGNTGADHNISIGFQAGDLTGPGNVAIGKGTLSGNNSGEYNVAIGFDAGNDVTTGQDNVLIGKNAADSLTTGGNNVIIGKQAGDGFTANTTMTLIGAEAGTAINSNNANGTVAVGYQSLVALTSGATNTALGTRSGDAATTASGSVFLGNNAGGTITTGNQNIAIGLNAMNGATTTGDNNIAVGSQQTLDALTSGFLNIAIGGKAGSAINTGNTNTVIGFQSGLSLTTASGSVAIGTSAMAIATTGNNNIAIGNAAANGGNTTGDNNISIGTTAGDALTSGHTNIFIGKNAGVDLTTGIQNIAIGEAALDAADGAEDYNIAIGQNSLGTLNNDGAQYNIAIGADSVAGGTAQLLGVVAIGQVAGQSINSADANYTVAVGYAALRNNTSGIGNVAVGYNALLSEDDGDRNTAVGYEALKDQTGVSGTVSNTAVGYKAGAAITTGIRNVIIGADAAVATTNIDSAVVIGNFAGGGGNMTADADGTVLIGRSAGSSITSGQGNIAIGHQALDAEDDGDFNTAIGYQALTDQTGTSGTVGNTAVGYRAGAAITTGISNVAIGYNAADAMTTGHNNVAIGLGAMGSSENIGYAVAVGSEALNNANTVDDSDSSVAIGNKALYALVSGIGNVAVGGEALSSEDDGDHNTAIGHNALKDQAGTTGTVGNTALGYKAGEHVLTGKFNTFIGGNSGEKASGSAADENAALGYAALGQLTSGSLNTALGTAAGQLFQNASKTVAVGYYTLANANTSTDIDGSVAVGALSQAENKTGIGNVSVGLSALQSNVNGDFNTAIGHESLKVVNGVSGQQHNTAVGYQSGLAMTTGKYNVIVGSQAGDAMTTAEGNTAVGFQSLSTNVDGDKNTGVGYRALFAHEPASDGHGKNTAVGYEAGNDVSTGTSNTIIGAEAGNTGTNDLSSGTLNTLIGADTAVSANDAENQTVIGRAATGQADNSVTLGNASVTDVYMAQDGDATVNCGQILSTLDDRVNAPGSGTGATVGLHISSSGVPYVKFTETNAASSGTADFEIYAANQTFVLYDVADGAQVFNVNTSQVISGDFNDTSDIGLKENIVSISEGLSIINQLNPVTFDWKKKSKGTNSGFIAQEVEKILPDDVEGTDYDESLKDLPPATVDNTGKSINLGGIVAHLTKAVQELSEQNKALEKRLEELESKS